MIKLIAFDLDGVLAATVDIHFETFNQALAEVAPGVSITRAQQDGRFEGVSTADKLKTLTVEQGLRVEDYPRVIAAKRRLTADAIRDRIKPNSQHVEMLTRLRPRYKLALVSNATAPSVLPVLEAAGLVEHLDFILSRDDFERPKPAPDGYVRAMELADALPCETLVVEDSHVGREAARRAGAHLLAVADCAEVSHERVTRRIAVIEAGGLKHEDLTVLVPMAGEGSRFKTAGYEKPKPLIDVLGKPMVQRVVESLNLPEANYTFAVRQQHQHDFDLNALLWEFAPGCIIIPIPEKTDGAARTVLLAQHGFRLDKPLLIFNSDQILDFDPQPFLDDIVARKLDGSILTFNACDPKYSYVRLGSDGLVAEVAEKRVISDLCTSGLYFWRLGIDFIRCAAAMIRKDIRVNNEYYVVPTYNEAIAEGLRIGHFPGRRIHDLGTPEGLMAYLERQERPQVA
jgi:HAD superfamily hydrolase (TIGR01509 family)